MMEHDSLSLCRRRARWIHPGRNYLRGKDVVLCFDADDAGQKAVARVSVILQGHSNSIRRLNWEALRHAC